MRNGENMDLRLGAWLRKVEDERRIGFDRWAEAAFALDVAGSLAGPVLDVGVGKGLFAVEVARRGLRVVGVDPDPEALRFARALAKREGVRARIRLLEADVADLPFPDGCFGAVVSMNALHHLASPGPALDTMARVVRPGGIVVLADLSAAGLDWIGKRHLEEKGVHHPVGPVTIETASAGLVSRGLEVRCVTLGRWETVVVLRKPAPFNPSP